VSDLCQFCGDQELAASGNYFSLTSFSLAIDGDMDAWWSCFVSFSCGVLALESDRLVTVIVGPFWPTGVHHQHQA
jgi:hypothetical protein